jgi:hypothetical protein
MKRAALVAMVVLLGCEKVPLTQVRAFFTLSDATWFEQEETMFIFYRLYADQGLGPNTQLELSWRTDEEVVEFTPFEKLAPVHLHLPATSCGPEIFSESFVDGGTGLGGGVTILQDGGFARPEGGAGVLGGFLPGEYRCGSISVRVKKEPRQVGLRLRYHRAGQQTLPSQVALNIVRTGPPSSNRSLLVYGVFDESNRRVQWRGRHQFPSLRNAVVQVLGLRRRFSIDGAAYGSVMLSSPYGYGDVASCDGLTPLGWPPRATDDRATFEEREIPLEALTLPAVCARSTVTDALGDFSATAVARKNPVVRPAFPELRTPVRTATPIRFLLRPCDRDISPPHLAMQQQRLLADDPEVICIDDVRTVTVELAGRLRARFEAERPKGADMVAVVILHQDDTRGAVATAIEAAFDQVLPLENDRTTPRGVGAFVFDSQAHTIRTARLRQLVLWCPARVPNSDLDTIPAASETNCPLLPDQPTIELGPFRFSTLPILPSRAQYLRFVEKHSEGQAGQTRALTFLAPTRPATSRNTPLGEFGVATQFGSERFAAEPSHAFSFCPSSDQQLQRVLFTIDGPIAGLFQIAPLSALPQVHRSIGQNLTYALHLGWEAPFLTRLEYNAPTGATFSVVGLTVPFGTAQVDTRFLGAEAWRRGVFSLSDVLLQCTQFCTHPTFNGGGVYEVNAAFSPAYEGQCYAPAFPALDGGGFPVDP